MNGAGVSRTCLTTFLVSIVVLATLHLVLTNTPTDDIVVPAASHRHNAAATPRKDAIAVCTNTDEPRYSQVVCIDEGDRTFIGSAKTYGFQIVNRSCKYTNIAYDPSINRFLYFAQDTPANRKIHAEGLLLPAVNLASRPYDLPIRPQKQSVIKRKIKWTYFYTPEVRWGPLPPCEEFPRDYRALGYYVPIVAPWNYAHTLFCDLFSLFWQMWEHQMLPYLDLQVVAVSSHYHSEFPLPNKNKAFDLFSRRQPIYDITLPKAVFPVLLVGSGTKSWSWVTPEYSASGSSLLWYTFRQHIINVTGAVDRAAPEEDDDGNESGSRHEKENKVLAADEYRGEGSAKKLPQLDGSRPVRVSICHKRDKRGVLNYNESVEFLRRAFPDKSRFEFVLEEAVGRSARDQVQMMIDADVYMCNEGTLATSFFLMPPGSVFLSLPLVYHGPHLHQRQMPSPSVWWKVPDMLRPDPRLNTGGNIDWFPPSIRWIRTFWYDQIPLNETRIQTPLMHLRNYMPDFNIIISEARIVPLMRRVMTFLATRKTGAWSVSNVSHEIELAPRRAGDDSESWHDPEGERPPNYSVTADLCRQILAKNPDWTKGFNSARCFYGMSWLCEFWANTQIRWRLLHEKWSLSHGRCGDRSTTLQYNPDINDVRKSKRSLHEYLFYSREELAVSYTTLDLGKFNASEEELDAVFKHPHLSV